MNKKRMDCILTFDKKNGHTRCHTLMGNHVQINGELDWVFEQVYTRFISDSKWPSNFVVLLYWCDPNKAYSFGQRLGPNHAQGPIHGPHAPPSPSPSRGLITRGMLKTIQLGFIQDGPNPHRLLTLFTWAKEDVKIWRGVSNSNRISIILAHCLGFAF